MEFSLVSYFWKMKNNPGAYWFREVWRNLKSPKPGLGAAVLTIGLCCFVMGVLGWLALVAKNSIPEPQEAGKIQVFVTARSERPAQLSALSQEISGLPLVDKIEFISREKAWDEFRQEFPPTMSSALDVNPLPSSFLIELKKDHRNPADMEVLRGQLLLVPGVEAVSPVSPYLTWLESWKIPVQSTGAFILVLVVLSFISVMYNSIQLSLVSRREVVENGLVLGAGFWMLVMPFVMEGAILGLLGGTLGTAAALSLTTLLRSLFPLAPQFTLELALVMPLGSITLAAFTSFATVTRLLLTKSRRS